MLSWFLHSLFCGNFFKAIWGRTGSFWHTVLHQISSVLPACVETPYIVEATTCSWLSPRMETWNNYFGNECAINLGKSFSVNGSWLNSAIFDVHEWGCSELDKLLGRQCLSGVWKWSWLCQSTSAFMGQPGHQGVNCGVLRGEWIYEYVGYTQGEVSTS